MCTNPPISEQGIVADFLVLSKRAGYSDKDIAASMAVCRGYECVTLQENARVSRTNLEASFSLVSR